MVNICVYIYICSNNQHENASSSFLLLYFLFPPVPQEAMPRQQSWVGAAVSWAKKTMAVSMERGTLMTRMTPTTPATRRLATVKALQTGTLMRRRGRTAMRVATAKMGARRRPCTRRMMEDCMREKRRVSTRMRRWCMMTRICTIWMGPSVRTWSLRSPPPQRQQPPQLWMYPTPDLLWRNSPLYTNSSPLPNPLTKHPTSLIHRARLHQYSLLLVNQQPNHLNSPSPKHSLSLSQPHLPLPSSQWPNL